MEKQIYIFDTTLRDGEQSPGCSMNLAEKLEMARMLERLNVDVIEAGFPASSPEDFEAVEQIATTVKKPVVAALCRARKEEIHTTYEALKNAVHPRIHIVLATSDIHLEYKLRMTREEVLAATAESVAYAKSLCEDVQFAAEDATRSDREFLLQVFNTAVEHGAAAINITDTVGYSTPEEFADLVAYIRQHLSRPALISVHCHNDLGMGVANALAAIRAGADQIECTVNGIGERAGNAALEEIVMAIYTRRQHYQAFTCVATSLLYPASRTLSSIIGVPVPPNKAIVGANAFCHEAGIHQHGILANRQTYEIISPETVGVHQTQIVLGKHSGKHAFIERLEQLGYELTDLEVETAFEKFKELSDRKKNITDRDIEAIIRPMGHSVPEEYQLDSFVINCGTVISATAVMKLRHCGRELETVSRGNGPIFAAYRAINKLVRHDFFLDDYNIQSVTEGDDALGEVVVRIRDEHRTVTGRGLSPDILEASILAYLNAVNKAVARHGQEYGPAR